MIYLGFIILDFEFNPIISLNYFYSIKKLFALQKNYKELKAQNKQSSHLRAGGRAVIGEAVEVEAGENVATAPAVALPGEVTDMQATVRNAVDGPPKANLFPLPLFGDQFWVGQQIIQGVGVKNQLVLKFLPELKSLDTPSLFLSLGQIKSDFGRVPLESLFLVAFHLPSFQDIRSLFVRKFFFAQESGKSLCPLFSILGVQFFS